MCSDMSLTPEGAREGIKEQKKKIKELVSKYAELVDNSRGVAIDEEMVSKIAHDILQRQYQVERLEHFLSQQT